MIDVSFWKQPEGTANRRARRVGWPLPVLLSAALLTACGGGQNDASSASSISATALAALPPDKPYLDPTGYGTGPGDSIADTHEDGAITHRAVTVGAQTIQYTATAGHLVTTDSNSSKPNAKIFYVAYTADGKDATTRPVTFFYNGGPGSASIWLLLGSYAPKRIKTSMPDFTPPAPYTIETNPDSLLDKTDLVFINPVGTGYSTAIAPNKNKDFWGVDQDAVSLKQFIKRYLTANQRWNSPKFLFGESYGTARSAVLANKLHKDGIELNGIVLQSSILDFRQSDNPVGLLPTYVADAWYHKKFAAPTTATTLAGVMDQAGKFASGDYATWTKPFVTAHAATEAARNDPEFQAAVQQFLADPSLASGSWSNLRGYFYTLPNGAGLVDTLDRFLQATAEEEGLPPPKDDAVLRVSQYIGIDKESVKTAKLAMSLDSFGRKLVPGMSVGFYDGRVKTTNLGGASEISLINNDAFNRATNGVYIAAWNVYLNQELKYTSNSAFTGINSDIGPAWDWTHADPTEKTSKARSDLNTVVDLASIMTLNPDLKVFQASGYYDSVTPWYQTRLDLQNMSIDPALRKNLQIHDYPSGHMIYLDPASRTAMKTDVTNFLQFVMTDRPAMKRILHLQRQAPPAP